MKHILFIVGLISILVLAGCGPQPTQNNEQQQGITVATTFFPLYELTRMVVGDTGEVFSIVPAHAEPHGFIPTPQDIIRLSQSDVYITLGVEFEEFEEELVESTRGDVVIVAAADGIEVIDIDEDEHAEHEEKEEEHHDEHSEHEEGHEDGHHDEEEHGEEHHDEHEHHHSGVDPHVWLSPHNAMQMVQTIAQGLQAVDSANAVVYQHNAQNAIQQLSVLDTEYETGLANCAKDTILVTHNAYSYLGKEYGFKTIEIHGLSPESEPTPKQMADLIDEAKEHDIKYVFYEELVDPRVSETIASQVGAQTLALNPVAGSKDGSDTYFSIMRENLANLRIALECQ